MPTERGSVYRYLRLQGSLISVDVERTSDGRSVRAARTPDRRIGRGEQNGTRCRRGRGADATDDGAATGGLVQLMAWSGGRVGHVQRCGSARLLDRTEARPLAPAPLSPRCGSSAAPQGGTDRKGPAWRWELPWPTRQGGSGAGGRRAIAGQGEGRSRWKGSVLPPHFGPAPVGSGGIQLVVTTQGLTLCNRRTVQ